MDWEVERKARPSGTNEYKGGQGGTEAQASERGPEVKRGAPIVLKTASRYQMQPLIPRC